jgi:hypothetical protein
MRRALVVDVVERDGGGGATGYKRPLASFRAPSMGIRVDARASAENGVAARTGAKLAERMGDVISREVTVKINNLWAMLHSHGAWLAAAVTIVMKPSRRFANV